MTGFNNAETQTLSRPNVTNSVSENRRFCNSNEKNIPRLSGICGLTPSFLPVHAVDNAAPERACSTRSSAKPTAPLAQHDPKELQPLYGSIEQIAFQAVCYNSTDRDWTLPSLRLTKMPALPSQMISCSGNNNVRQKPIANRVADNRSISASPRNSAPEFLRSLTSNIMRN